MYDCYLQTAIQYTSVDPAEVLVQVSVHPFFDTIGTPTPVTYVPGADVTGVATTIGISLNGVPN